MRQFRGIIFLCLLFAGRAGAQTDTLFILRCVAEHPDSFLVLAVFKGMPEVMQEGNPRKVRYRGTAVLRDTSGVQYLAPDYLVTGCDTARTELRWTTEQDTIPSGYPRVMYLFKNGLFQPR